KAAVELEKFAESAEPALQKAVRDKPPPEVGRRIELLLARLQAHRLLALRATEVLEHIGTSEAKALLKHLSTGAAEARLTQEAKASLDRLAKRAAAAL